MQNTKVRLVFHLQCARTLLSKYSAKLKPACAEALLDCYRECSILGWCCKEENAAFWNCYTAQRVRLLEAHCEFKTPWHSPVTQHEGGCSLKAAWRQGVEENGGGRCLISVV